MRIPEATIKLPKQLIFKNQPKKSVSESIEIRNQNFTNQAPLHWIMNEILYNTWFSIRRPCRVQFELQMRTQAAWTPVKMENDGRTFG